MTETYNEILAQTGKREAAFRAMLYYLISIGDGDLKTYVETGCVRAPDDYGAGYSTVLFDRYAQIDGYLLPISIDSNPGNIAFAERLCPRTKFFRGDSVSVLSALPVSGLIDVLYLDSLDFDVTNPVPCAQHALMELTAAAPRLRAGSLVAVDDNVGNLGKGALVREFMQRCNKTLLVDGYTLVWKW